MRGGKAAHRWWVPRPAKALRPRQVRKALLWGFLAFLLLDLCFPLPAHKPYSPQVMARDGSLLRAYLSTDDKWRMETTVADAPPFLVDALVAKEDRWFWWHWGVNPLAAGRALWNNAWSGERTSGASTITMQVARMLEPKSRTVWSKLKESFRALQLEWHHSKPEIMGMYMSYLPYGGNVEGVTAASYLYFQRPPKALSPAQCLLLTVIPNRPNSLRPDLAPAAAQAARDKWLRRLSSEGLLPADHLADALAEPLPQTRHPLPYQAQQFCQSALKGQAAARLATTLDPEMQHIAQQLLKQHVTRNTGDGISNGAVLVVDNRTMEVRAYCGSADFEDKAAQGEVDAIHAVRSPGSTLKPFIYAMALDLGLITPRMKLLDIPREFSDFDPVNYDRSFRGEVEAAEALRHSLNLPAVRLLNAVGLRRFVHHLRRAGFESITRHSGDLGLSLALGGCGATLEELVRAYAALANGGVLRPLRIHADAPAAPEGLRMCSPEAAYIVSDILSGIQRPDLPATFIAQSKLPQVAWKTGTSFGRRDAWSVGYNPRYTIGVWMGNMDGRPVMEMSGAKTAVPLLLELFNALDHDAGKAWLQAPPRAGKRVVCTDTGLPPGPRCQHLATDHYIAGVSPQQRCDRYRQVYTDREGKVQYCMACLPAGGYELRDYPVFSPEYTLWLYENRADFARPPVHNPACTAVFQGEGPDIHSPVKGQTYYVLEGSELMLQAAPDPSTSQHFWFVNGHFMGACEAGGKVFFQPRAGQLEVVCLDDKGRSRAMRVEVEVI